MIMLLKARLDKLSYSWTSKIHLTDQSLLLSQMSQIFCCSLTKLAALLHPLNAAVNSENSNSDSFQENVSTAKNSPSF